MPSYSVKCHFEWSPTKVRSQAHLYEERITLWNTNNIDQAIESAKQEARKYAKENAFTFLELTQAFWMFQDIEGNGLELFSLLRESDLAPSDYLDLFHDTRLDPELKAQPDQDA